MMFTDDAEHNIMKFTDQQNFGPILFILEIQTKKVNNLD